MLDRLNWKRLMFELLMTLAISTLAGLFFHHVTGFISLGLLFLILWHFSQLMRLSHWLWVDRSMTPPTGYGSWESLFYGINLMQGRSMRRRRELRNLIQRFRSGAESLPDALVMVTGDGSIFWCNGLAQQFLALRWPEDNGQNIQNLLRYPQFTRYFQQQNFKQPLSIQLHSGQQIEFRIMRYSDDQWLIVARDISQLYQLEHMRRNFLADVSHELRTPLTVLQGYLEMLDSNSISSVGQQKALSTMRSQTTRMSSLVEQLLTLSRIESAPVRETRHWVDVPILLNQLHQQALTLSSGRHNIEFIIDNSLKVQANEDQLCSAMSNLVFNAIHHTPEETHIKVKWYKTANGAQFSVCDNGPGIDPTHLPRLTERFYRIDAARSRNTGGSGLGLAIVKHALSHHGSRLQISSEPNVSTNFSFILPKPPIGP